MAAEFKNIYFTPPSGDPGETALRIKAALTLGRFDIAHLRLPGATESEVEEAIDRVYYKFRPRVTLHDHFGLAEKYGLGGVHLNSRNPRAPEGWKGRLSRSCHTPEEAEACARSGEYDYVTLSPVFPSISKPGYKADFDGVVAGAPGIVALGGVTPDRLPGLRRRGFSGAAILGWLDAGLSTFLGRLRRMRMVGREEFALQYITNGATPDEVESEVRDVLAGGCRWVQIRMKDAGNRDVAEAAARVVPLCRETGAICLLDDRAEMVAFTGADGVHLGKGDMSPAEARKLLGEGRIIGSTANSLDDIRRIVAAGASDYIGLGPFRFTTTKRRLAPVLGLDGYRDIFSHPEARQLPAVAIGGIGKGDAAALIAAGASGVAVSGAIFRASDRPAAARELLSEAIEAIESINQSKPTI